MTISKDDILFSKIDRENYSVSEQNIAFVQHNFSDAHAFSNYIRGYKLSADATYDSFITTIDKSVKDTIYYPLCFMHRHIAELYIKFLYVGLIGNSKEDYKDFFFKNGHNLIKLWQNIQPKLFSLARRVGYKYNSGAITSYVRQISDIDKMSFTFRYPTEKDGEKALKETFLFDVKLFHERMKQLYIEFDTILLNIDGQLEKFKESPDFNKALLCFLSKVKPKYDMLLNDLETLVTPKENKLEIISFDDIDIHESVELYEKIGQIDKKYTEDEKTWFKLLFYSGQDLVYGLCQLAHESTEKRDDLYKLLYSNLETYPSDKDVNSREFIDSVLSKGEFSIKCLEKIITELESCNIILGDKA